MSEIKYNLPDGYLKNSSGRTISALGNLKIIDVVMTINTSIKYKPKMSQETSRIIYGG